MQRLAVVAKLRPGAGEEAARLIELGPPLDLAKAGMERHTVFLAPDTVVFVFEGGNPNVVLNALTGADEQSVLGAWEPLLSETPTLAREAYSWISPAYAQETVWAE
jgi:hypothetical protein